MRASIEQVSDALLQVYPILGGVGLSSRCKYVVDPEGSAVRASPYSGDVTSPQGVLRNKRYCDAQFTKFNGSSKNSEFYRAFAHQWEGRMRGAETLDGRKHTQAELLNREFACNTLSSSWAPHACAASVPLVDATPWLPFCSAFAYFYNGHYKILNKFVALLDLCNDDRSSAIIAHGCGDSVSRAFAANYNFLMANGPLRWNYATAGEMFRSSDCAWASWALPDRGDTWHTSGLPGQFWAEVATGIDQGLSAMPGLPFALTVYKGMESDPLYFSSFENNINRKAGETFELNGFNSTTLDMGIALEYAHAVGTVRGVFVFNLPVGTLCHYKHDNTNPTYQVLLPRKRVFRVSRTSTVIHNGETYRLIFCDLLNPTGPFPNLQLDLGLPAGCALLPSSSMPWALRLYEMYRSLTMCDPPVVIAAEYAQEPPIPLLQCYLQLQQLAIATGICIGTCPFVDVSFPSPPSPPPSPPQPQPGTQHLTVYRVVEQGDTGGLSNGNSADLEGQLSYTALSLPRRHADWDTRIMQKYNVDYMPLNQCGESESSVCPPFGVYAKCNPGGCASSTNCSTDANCPGEGGVCTGGQCVCCGPNNTCSVDRDCGTGQCTSGKCVCTGIDQSYKCNVAEYPQYTNSVMGDTQHVGAIPAPFDASTYPKGAWAPTGFWYSTPEPGLCKPGQTLGEGCSWSTTGVDKQFTIGELADRGFKVYCDPKKNPGKKCSSKKEVMMSQHENLDILNNLFN